MGGRGGRPKGTKTPSTIAAEAFKKYLVDEVIKHKAPLVAALIKRGMKGDVQALKEINERVIGKVTQSVDAMREIQAFDAKARLPQLLDDVERGETLIITRHGRAIARIVPEVDRRQEEVDRALASIRELRKRTVKVSIEEILSAKEEGRKY